MGSNAQWLASLTPILARQRAEESAFARYCVQRDMGFSAFGIAHLFAPYDRHGDFEARYQAERRLG